MQAMTVAELRNLIGEHTPPCVSLYVPTHRGGSPEDRHHFDGAIHSARGELKKLVPRDLDALLAPITELSTPAFWKSTSLGLAIFRSRDHFACYRLPMQVPELALVADSFHIRPLLRFLQSNQRYYLLSLSQNRVAFFKGGAEGLAPVDLDHMPRSLEGALGTEDRERSIHVHQGARGAASPIYGGGSKSDSSRDEDLARFFRAVDRALWPVLGHETVPLILASTERELPLFRSISRYSHIAEQALHGNFADAKMEDMHAKAWPIVQHIVEARTDEVRKRYDALVSRARALDEIRGIASYAVQGRVHQLLLERDAQLWGKLDKSNGSLELHGSTRVKGDDVLDDLAEAVLVRGGEVFAVEKARMPSKSPVAAILRW
jgi:hypothetical protein